jgi:hypothetical protein
VIPAMLPGRAAARDNAPLKGLNPFFTMG